MLVIYGMFIRNGISLSLEVFIKSIRMINQVLMWETLMEIQLRILQHKYSVRKHYQNYFFYPVAHFNFLLTDHDAKLLF